MKLNVQFGWGIEGDLTDFGVHGSAITDGAPLELSREDFTLLLQEGAFGKKVVVTFEVEGDYVLYTVNVDDQIDPSEFFERFFNTLTSFFTVKQH